MTSFDRISSLEDRISFLEKELQKQKKISEALKSRVKRSMQLSGSNYSMFESNILLQNETERRTESLLQQKIQADQENIAKSDFFASMSHELRSPMHAILSYSQMGERKYLKADRDKLRKYFDSINTSGKRLLRLIDDLLDLEKLESGKFQIAIEDNDLIELVDNILQENMSLVESKNINLVWNRCVDHLKLECDADRIRQIVQNFLSNAIKFTPSNSTIKVKCEPTKIDQHPAVMFSIADQGPGIPESELEVIFERYEQSSNNNHQSGGTGLGLPICKELINLHNGKIWVKNQTPHGCIFYFALPVSYEEKSNIATDQQ